MAVNNKIAPTEKKKNEMIYMLADGQQITLTPETVKNYLVSGNSEAVTMQEVVMFMNLCRFQQLNPWLKEAYLIKYSQKSPATLVIGKDTYFKRAEAHPAYDGLEAGTIVLNNGEVIKRDGAFILPDDELIGAWATCYRKDRSRPTIVAVMFNEYAGRKPDGELNSQWASKPATMIVKVAQVHALREAFPGILGNAPTADEVAETPDLVFESTAVEVDKTGTPVTQPQEEITQPDPESQPQEQAGQRSFTDFFNK